MYNTAISSFLNRGKFVTLFLKSYDELEPKIMFITLNAEIEFISEIS